MPDPVKSRFPDSSMKTYRGSVGWIGEPFSTAVNRYYSTHDERAPATLSEETATGAWLRSPPVGRAGLRLEVTREIDDGLGES